MRTSLNHSELTMLYVDHDGTITDPTVPEPRTRADVFGSINLQFVHSAEDLVDEIQRCEPLIWHWRQLGQEQVIKLTQRVVDGGSGAGLISGPLLSPSERLILRALREDKDDGWQKWIEFSGEIQLECFKSKVEHWLASDIDWAQEAHFEPGYSGQHLAKVILENLPLRILKALGVVIVNREHPSSTISPARLRKSVLEANEVAQLRELAIRFSQHPKWQSKVAALEASVMGVLA